MEQNWKPSLSKTYTILLIVASALLLFIASVSYKRILGLQDSSNLISKTLEIEGKINELFFYYPTMQTAELKALLARDSTKISSATHYKQQSEITLGQLRQLLVESPTQVAYLDSVEVLQNQFYSSLSQLKQAGPDSLAVQSVNRETIGNVSRILAKMMGFKNKMLAAENQKIKTQREIYGDNLEAAPLSLLLLSLFALSIFVFSFRRLYLSRKRVQRTQVFLENILKHSNNIIGFAVPVYGEDEQLQDFTLEFANDNIQELGTPTLGTVLGKPMSGTFPNFRDNGMFQAMKTCLELQQTQYQEESYPLAGGNNYFYSSYSPSLEGIHFTSVNITTLKNAELLVQKANKELASLNNRLTVQNTLLENAELLANIGSFRWDLDQNQSEISPSFYTLLGCEPSDFDSSMEGIRSLVHPEDLSTYDKKIKQVIKKQEITQFIYRVITKAGKIKQLKTYLHIVDQGQGPFMLGVSQDVTNQMAYEQKLKRKNAELKLTNTELKSFNRVASHDLQEPLRKIQMFISRINEEELEHLGTKGKVYFEKIDDAAKRMRSLIQYLLAYSRISKKEKKSKAVDLNAILGSVLEDYAERIDEKQAGLQVDHLATVKAVPFQMEQLFSNLISNALKYSREGIPPSITIFSEILPKKEIPETFPKTAKRYHKITIADNGIGFDNANKDKIFEVFQRLHAKDAFSGTGIGLAICKKIVDQHGGHIDAHGEPGQGASFYFYLPA